MKGRGRGAGFTFVYKRDKGLCRYCGEPGQTLDHVTPKIRGGTDDPFTNLVLACKPCNSMKGREEGFILRYGVLLYGEYVIAPYAVWGDALWEMIRRQRLERQADSGLVWAQQKLASA